MDRGIALKVSGEYACFSRPEFKVERVSYPVITPSAARGVLEAVFWKPEIRYQVREIHILQLGSTFSILRNEVSDRGGGFRAQDRRQQRTSLVLRNVEYIIRAEFSVRSHVAAEPGKYLDQFNRRVTRGQCHHMPCLGTREFSARFEPVSDADRPAPDLNLDIGQMLFDIAFIPSPDGKAELTFFRPGPSGQKEVRGRAEPVFFHARIADGVLHVPREKYGELYRMEEADA